jgi:hypothetical protein
MKPYYVNPTEFYNQMIISKNQDKLTDESITMIMKIIDKYATKFKYKDYMDLEDCKSHAIMQILRNWRSYDPDKSPNAFSYFTQSAKMGLYMGWNKLYEYKKNGMHISYEGIFSMNS